MDHLDAATLVKSFRRLSTKIHMPNNAVLVVAGDFETEEARQWIEKC
jgi:predicted Zn-dependent peptidase